MCQYSAIWNWIVSHFSIIYLLEYRKLKISRIIQPTSMWARCHAVSLPDYLWFTWLPSAVTDNHTTFRAEVCYNICGWLVKVPLTVIAGVVSQLAYRKWCLYKCLHSWHTCSLGQCIYIKLKMFGASPFHKGRDIELTGSITEWLEFVILVDVPQRSGVRDPNLDLGFSPVPSLIQISLHIAFSFPATFC